MIVYLSGGSEIAETSAKSPHVMMSFWCHSRRKRTVPNARMKELLKQRKLEMMAEEAERMIDSIKGAKRG